MLQSICVKKTIILKHLFQKKRVAEAGAINKMYYFWIRLSYWKQRLILNIVWWHLEHALLLICVVRKSLFVAHVHSVHLTTKVCCKPIPPRPGSADCQNVHGFVALIDTHLSSNIVLTEMVARSCWSGPQIFVMQNLFTHVVFFVAC